MMYEYERSKINQSYFLYKYNALKLTNILPVSLYFIFSILLLHHLLFLFPFPYDFIIFSFIHIHFLLTFLLYVLSNPHVYLIVFSLNYIGFHLPFFSLNVHKTFLQSFLVLKRKCIISRKSESLL